MANLDLKALLQGIKPVPSVPSKSPTNFTTANQNPTESAGYQDYDEYQVIDEYNQDDAYSGSSYDHDVHDRRHARSRSTDRDIRKPTTASSNNTQLPVCQWYSQRGVCRRFKSLCPKSHPGSISTQNGMVHERPKGGG